MSDNNFEMVAKTFQGLEGVLADELTALGAHDVQQGKRMVSFTGDKEMLYRANFCLRTALRVLKPIYKFRSADADDLYEQVGKFDWSTVLSPDKTFAIDATVFSESFRHSRFVTYRVKDAIADQFMDRDGRRPSISVTNPDMRFDVHIAQDEVTISLDSSGAPLYRRGWREASTEAPINEVLAAGILKLAGWQGQCDLVDPMCGSGTFLVEAALMAANINPCVFRQDYAFQHWADYDEELFDRIYNDDSQERDFTHKIYGYDIALQAVAISERNVKSAGVSRWVEVDQRDIRDWQSAPEGGMLVTNPPYGERLKYQDIDDIYASLGQKLKHVFQGYNAWIIGYDKELNDLIGLKPSVHYPLLNGELECELRQYVIFAGKYGEMKREGGDIKNRDFRAADADRGARKRPFKETFGPRKDYRGRRDDDEGDAPRKERGPKGPHRFRDRDDEGGPRKPKFGKHGDDRRRDAQDRQRDIQGRRRDAQDQRQRLFGKDRRDDRDEKQDRDQYFFSDRHARNVVRHQEPTLGRDAERPIVHGRRNSWKRRDDVTLRRPKNDGGNQNGSDDDKKQE